MGRGQSVVGLPFSSMPCSLATAGLNTRVRKVAIRRTPPPGVCGLVVSTLGHHARPPTICVDATGLTIGARSDNPRRHDALITVLFRVR